MRVDELGLKIDAKDSRLQFIPVDLSQPNMGIPEDHLEEICMHADVIIHSIWTVNYALSLASFTPEILKSVYAVIEIANRAASRPRVVFTSSIGSVHRWAKAISPSVPVPEEVINCTAAAMATGYGQSKQVAERFLAAAGAKLQIPISILRIGQIAGPTKIEEGGKWESHDWLHSLAILSKASGLVPINPALINWVPVDQVASVIQEIALREKHDDHETATPNVQLYNIVHPRPVPTSKFSEGLQKCISSPRLVTYPEWVEHLSGLPPNRLSREAEEERARVLPFFRTIVNEGFARFDIHKALAVSPTMSGMGPIEEESIAKWCHQWTETEDI
jgi:thioester reductase-like protein